MTEEYRLIQALTAFIRMVRRLLSRTTSLDCAG